MRVCLVVLLAISCSKKSEPPKAGSGSPTVADASITADAPVEVDAQVTGDKLSAVPEGGILLATTANEKLVIAKLDRTGLRKTHEQPVSQTAELAWLDAKTLVVHDGTKVMKLVDGKPTETAELDEEWEMAELLVTKSGAVWFEKCATEMVGPEPCPKFQHLGVMPKQTGKLPADVDRIRTAGGAWGRGLQGTITPVAAPADVKLEKVKLAAKDTKVVAIKCTKGGQSSTFPNLDEFDTAYAYTAKSTRWVLTEPAIYEVTGDEVDPVGQTNVKHDYLVACQPKELQGFLSLGGPVWAELKENDTSGVWTIRVGTTDIATLEGGAIRANR